MRLLLVLLNAVWSTRGVLHGCWGGDRESADGMGEWTYSAHWRSREQ